ncbi:M15 family metallopeptidase [Patescibacteria group bacterium]|nr:M15 family metallopeptidase [Patescibacteria group bacterium]
MTKFAASLAVFLLLVLTVKLIPLHFGATAANNSILSPKSSQAPTDETGNRQIPAEQKILGDAANKTCHGFNDLDILVDKFHGLPADYAPADLTEVEGFPVRAEAATYLTNLLAAMRRRGLDITIDSTYRTYSQQKTIYDQRHRGNLTAAPAGYSEHQLGTAVDFNILYPSAAWTWLDQNAQKFGFVMSYRSNQITRSGYTFEPWHWRYVGVDLATKIRYSSAIPQSFYQPLGCR